MTSSNRPIVLFACMLALVLAGSMWSVDWMRSKRSGAALAAAELDEVVDLAQTIVSLRTQPTIASDQDMGAGELGQRIEYASRQSNLGASSLESVQPQVPRRIGDSPYLHKPTDLRLRDLSMRQMTLFLHHLTTDSGLHLEALRLMTPTGLAETDRWTVEATLVEVIYRPLGTQ